MNLEQLQYIIEVSKLGSLTKAAQKLHVTLSAISQSISLLEKELGVRLFVRSRGQNTLPTEEGKAVIERATEILKKINELKEEVDTYKNTLSGELRIATIPGPMHLLVDTVTQFKKDFPDVKIKIFEQGPKEIVENILEDKIDIGLIVLNEEYLPKNSNLVFDVVLEGKMVVAVNSESQIAKKALITPEMLIKETLVLFDDEIIQQYIDKNIANIKDLNILFTTNNVMAIHNALLKGLAVTIGLDFSFNKNPKYGQKVVTINLNTAENERVSYGWVRTDNKPSSQIAKTFIKRLVLDI